MWFAAITCRLWVRTSPADIICRAQLMATRTALDGEFPPQKPAARALAGAGRYFGRPGRGKRAHSDLLPPMLPRSNFCLSWLAAKSKYKLLI
jgi:hypothetical protein